MSTSTSLNNIVALGLLTVIWSVIIAVMFSAMFSPIALLLYAGYRLGKYTTKRLITE